MLKVLEVSSDSNIGGAGKCILTFLKTFDRSRFSVGAVLPKDSLLKPEIAALDIPVYEMENLAEKSLDFRAVRALRRLFQKLKPDVVHTHASMSARFAAFSLGIPVVYTRHSVFPPPAALTRFPGKQINGLVNNLTASKIIAVAEAAKDNLTDTGVSAKKIEVILNGVAALPEVSEEAVAMLEHTFGIAPGDKVAVMAARLNVVKGHTYFIKAAEILRSRGVDAKFLIAGTGEMEQDLKAQIKEKHLEDQVIMMGFVTDVAPLMQRMDVQVNCSFGTEATSLSLLEGMSLGKPAVVSDFGGNPGVIADGVNGFITPTHDAAALADRLEQLFCDAALYQTMAQNCRRIFEEKFTAAVNTRAIERVYESVADQKRKTKA